MVKTHKITGLKYLCQTKRKNPYKYLGSGKYWSQHLIKHGKEINTNIICECQTKEELRERGLYYSELWDIVNSKDEYGKKVWANLMPETGNGGRTTPVIWNRGKKLGPRSEEIKEKQRGANNHFYNKKHSDKTKELMKENQPDKSGSNNPNWRGGPEFHKNKRKFTNETDRQHAQSMMMLETNPMSDPKVKQKHLESVRNRPMFVCLHCGVSMVKAGLVVHQKALARKGIMVDHF